MSIPSIESLHTDGNCIANLESLTGSVHTGHDTLTELYLDMRGDDFRGDLLNFLQNSGSQLSTLELRKMNDPVDISQLSRLCPALKRLKVTEFSISIYKVFYKILDR